MRKCLCEFISRVFAKKCSGVEEIMECFIVGFPRVGSQRELKFASEKYFKGELNQNELLKISRTLRAEQWKWQELCEC